MAQNRTFGASLHLPLQSQETSAIAGRLLRHVAGLKRQCRLVRVSCVQQGTTNDIPRYHSGGAVVTRDHNSVGGGEGGTRMGLTRSSPGNLRARSRARLELW